MSVVPAPKGVGGGRTRAFELACALLALGTMVMLTFAAARLAVHVGLPEEGRRVAIMAADAGHGLFGLELLLVAAFGLLAFAVRPTITTMLVAIGTLLVAIVEIRGDHLAFATALASRLDAFGADIQTSKLLVYLALGSLVAGLAAIGMQLARDECDRELALRTLVVFLALGLGAGFTDAVVAVVKSYVSFGRSILILFEMAGELAAATFGVWLLADQLEQRRVMRPTVTSEIALLA